MHTHTRIAHAQRTIELVDSLFFSSFSPKNSKTKTKKRFAEGKAFDNIIAKITGKKDAELGATFEACKERCTAEGDGCTAIYLFKTKQGVPKCNVSESS